MDIFMTRILILMYGLGNCSGISSSIIFERIGELALCSSNLPTMRPDHTASREAMVEALKTVNPVACQLHCQLIIRSKKLRRCRRVDHYSFTYQGQLSAYHETRGHQLQCMIWGCTASSI
jgi:hypothetical protein